MSLYICFCYKTLKVQFVECNAMQWHILPYHIWYIYRCSWCCANDLDIGVQPILAPTMSVWYFSSILCSFLSGTVLVGTASLSAVYYLRPQQCWCLFQCTGLSAFKFFEFFHTYWYGDSNSRLRVIAMTWQIFPLPSCLTMDGIRENEKKKKLWCRSRCRSHEAWLWTWHARTIWKALTRWSYRWQTLNNYVGRNGVFHSFPLLGIWENIPHKHDVIVVYWHRISHPE